jgi:hypothetical protein
MCHPSPWRNAIFSPESVACFEKAFCQKIKVSKNIVAFCYRQFASYGEFVLVGHFALYFVIDSKIKNLYYKSEGFLHNKSLSKFTR